MTFIRTNIGTSFFVLATFITVEAFLSTSPPRSRGVTSSSEIVTPDRPSSNKNSALFISTHSNTDRNFYAILQVNRKANDAEIKLAYRRLAKLYHPGMTFFLPVVAPSTVPIRVSLIFLKSLIVFPQIPI
jgi:hypothetical protein